MGGVVLQIVAGIILLIIAFIGMAVSTGGLRLALRQRRLDARGVDATGTVIRHREQAPNRFFTYRFEVDGKSYAHEEALGGDIEAMPPIGASVPIRFLAAQPKYNGMTGDTPYSGVYRRINPLVTGAVVLIFAAVGTAGAWLILSASGTG